ncbi:MAG: endonuclease domain-containing protein [Lysobacteraceae bacterium]
MAAQYRPPMATVALEQAHALRSGSTDAEQRLWHCLRGRQLDGLKFRRQHPMHPYIVDFYCDAAKLVIELDGSQHTDEGDKARSLALEARGVKVLRLWNHEVLTQTESVIAAIWNAVQELPLTPTPLPRGQGLKECDP